jgi:hypothetical protein
MQSLDGGAKDEVVHTGAFTRIANRSSAILSSFAQFQNLTLTGPTSAGAGAKQGMASGSIAGLTSILSLNLSRVDMRPSRSVLGSVGKGLGATPSTAVAASTISGFRNTAGRVGASVASTAAAAAAATAAAAQAAKEATSAAEFAAARQRKFDDFCVAHDSVQATDTLYTVLERMHVNRTHKVFVLSPTGQPVGVVSLMDLARFLISLEGSEKVNLNDFVQARKHTDCSVREPHHSRR